MRSYKELSALPAEAYLNAATFATDWDSRNPNRERQYQRGLELGRKAKYISIGRYSVYSAKLKDGADLSSCEGIGYHAWTSALLQGFLDSNCPIVVYRNGNNPIWIKGQPVPREDGR